MEYPLSTISTTSHYFLVYYIKAWVDIFLMLSESAFYVYATYSCKISSNSLQLTKWV